MINTAFHHMALFTFHPNIQVFHLQSIRFHEASTQHMAIRKVFDFLEESPSVNKRLKTGNIHLCSIVFLNVVDHTVRLKLSGKSNCNLIYGWHMPELTMELHYSHPLLLFSKPLACEWSDSL